MSISNKKYLLIVGHQVKQKGALNNVIQGKRKVYSSTVKIFLASL